jgi:hypothetical protein
MYRFNFFLFFTIIFSFISNVLFSQSPQFNWSKAWGYQQNSQIGQVYAEDIFADNQGNVYVISRGNSQVDFDPSNNVIVAPFVAPSAAISKFDFNGNLIWVKMFNRTGGTFLDINPEKIDVKNGKIFVTGNFSGTYDFNPNVGVNTMSSNGGNFLCVLDIDGNYLWSSTFGGSGTYSHDIEVDDIGNIYITGRFNQSISFPNLGSITPNGGWDIFLVKLNPTGSGLWVNSYGSTLTDDSGESLLILDDQSVIFTGYFGSTVDFDPGQGILNFTSNGDHDLFIQRLGQNNNIIWTNTAGNTGADRGYSLTKDINGDIYLAGLLSLNADFSSWGSNIILNGLGSSNDSFVLKLDTNSVPIWGKRLQTDGTQVGSSRAVAITTSNNGIYVTGHFNGTIDFNPNSGVYNQTAFGNLSFNSYILTFNLQGEFYSAGVLNHTSNTSAFNNRPSSISYGNGNIYVAGEFKGPVDFDPSNTISTLNSATNNSGVSDWSAYVVSFNSCVVDTSNLLVNTCDSYISPSGQVYTQSGQYFSVLTSTSGCDSIVKISLTINSPTSSNIDITSCNSYISPSGVNYYTSGFYIDTITNNAGCDSLININLSIVSIDTAVTKSGSTLTANQLGATYQWYNCNTNSPILGANGQSYNATSPGWYSVLVNLNGCSEMSSCKQIKKVVISPINFGNVSIEDNEEKNLTIYPNPTFDLINIRGLGNQLQTIKILDLSGKIIVESTDTEKIDVCNLEPGLYQLMVLFENRQYTRQFVKL